MEKQYLEFSDIESLLSGQIEIIHNMLDASLLEDELSTHVIRRLATERATIRRIRNVLLGDYNV